MFVSFLSGHNVSLGHHLQRTPGPRATFKHTINLYDGCFPHVCIRHEHVGNISIPGTTDNSLDPMLGFGLTAES